MIKLIAVDMDGTFLDQNKQYNKEKFAWQYAQLKQHGIHFVAASGNQLPTLRHYFSDIADEIAYVAENGACVMDGQTEVSFQYFAPSTVQAMLESLQNYSKALIVCGKKSAYMGPNVPEKTLDRLNKYFKKLTRVNNLAEIDDEICKMTINTEICDMTTLTLHLNRQAYIQQRQVKLVSSGFDFIDLIVPGQHKAQGLKQLQTRWNVKDDEILAFGDNYNDLEMLEMAGYSYAMKNAVYEVKKVAKYQTDTNNQEGVLNVLDKLLEQEYPFLHCLPLAVSS